MVLGNNISPEIWFHRETSKPLQWCKTFTQCSQKYFYFSESKFWMYLGLRATAGIPNAVYWKTCSLWAKTWENFFIQEKKSKANASFAIFEFRRIAHWRILHSKIKQRRIISACILLSLHQRFYILIQAEWNLYFLPRIKVPCKRLKSWLKLL